MGVTHCLAEANKTSSPTGKCDVIDLSTEGRGVERRGGKPNVFSRGVKTTLVQPLFFVLSFIYNRLSHSDSH
jgi:hypothetical protein